MKNLFTIFSFSRFSRPDFPLVLLTLCVLPFLTLYVLMSIYNRPVADDFSYIAIFQHIDWRASVAILFDWNERWTSNISLATWIFLSSGHSFSSITIALFTLSHLVIIFIALWLILKAIIRHYTFAFTQLTTALYAVLFVAIFWYATPMQIECWFWTSASTMYIQSCSLSLLGTAMILQHGFRLHQVIVIILCFAYCGGAVENYAMFVISALVIGLFYLFRMHDFSIKPALQNPYVRKCLLALIFITISFSITLLLPALQHRVTYEQAQCAVFRSNTNLNALFNYRLLLSIVLAAPFYFLGAANPKQFPPLTSRFLFHLSVVFLILFAINQLPQLYVYGHIHIGRTWMAISLMLAVIFAGFFYFLGTITNKPPFLIYFVCIFGIVGIIGQLSLIWKHYSPMKRYAESYDSRILTLLASEKAGFVGTMEVPALHEPEILINGDITQNENEHVNIYYCRALELHYKVRRRKNQ